MPFNFLQNRCNPFPFSCQCINNRGYIEHAAVTVRRYVANGRSSGEQHLSAMLPTCRVGYANSCHPTICVSAPLPKKRQSTEIFFNQSSIFSTWHCDRCGLWVSHKGAAATLVSPCRKTAKLQEQSSHGRSQLGFNPLRSLLTSQETKSTPGSFAAKNPAVAPRAK